jgi:hypothetical protein
MPRTVYITRDEITAAIIERNVAKRIRRRIDQNAPDGCWKWTGGCNSSGYGMTSVRHRGVLVSQIMWFLASGHWPTRGEAICHDCPEGDNPRCVRNDTVGTYILDGVSYEKRGHLWLGTQAANIRDMDLKGRRIVQTGDAHGTHLHPETVPRGETHPKAKLTAEIVLEARGLVHGGHATCAELARLHGVAVPVMWNAVRGKTWTHL